MKRILKFRSWNGEKMSQPFELGSYLSYNSRGEFSQFTGLYDKKGKEIYEGDVVECDMTYKDSTLPHMGVIVWVDRVGAFATKNQAGETLLHFHVLSSLKVIGNVYENPKLYEQAGI